MIKIVPLLKSSSAIATNKVIRTSSITVSAAVGKMSVTLRVNHLVGCSYFLQIRKSDLTCATISLASWEAFPAIFDTCDD